MSDRISLRDDPSVLSENLDALVHEEASKMASTINNDGKGEQIEYLLQRGWTEDEIRKAASK